jgi:hypothetical protein
LSAPDSKNRRGALEEAAVSIGEEWARSWLAKLAVEKRRVAGGWPGTMSQARALVVAELVRPRYQPVLDHEIREVAQAAYARAKVVWLRSAKEDVDLPLEEAPT